MELKNQFAQIEVIFPELDGTSCNTVAFMLLNGQHLLSVKHYQFDAFSRKLKRL